MIMPAFTALHTDLNNGGYPAPSDPDLTPVSLVDLHALLDGVETEYRRAADSKTDDATLDNVIRDRITNIMSSHVTGNIIDKDPGETFDEIDDDNHRITLSRGLLRRVLSLHPTNPVSDITGQTTTERDIIHSALVENFTDDFERWFNRAVLDQNTVVYIRVRRDPAPATAADTTTPDVYESIFLDLTNPHIVDLNFNDRSLTAALDRATTAHEKVKTISRHLNNSIRTTITAHRYTDPDKEITLTSRIRRTSIGDCNTTVTTCPPSVITDHITREPLHTWRLTGFN